LAGEQIKSRVHIVYSLETPLFRYRDFNQRLAFVNAVLEKIRATPGVVNASATSQFPLSLPQH